MRIQERYTADISRRLFQNPFLLANGSRDVSLGTKRVAEEHARRHKPRLALQKASAQFP